MNIEIFISHLRLRNQVLNPTNPQFGKDVTSKHKRTVILPEF